RRLRGRVRKKAVRPDPALTAQRIPPRRRAAGAASPSARVIGPHGGAPGERALHLTGPGGRVGKEVAVKGHEPQAERAPSRWPARAAGGMWPSPRTDPTNPFAQESVGEFRAAEVNNERRLSEPGLTDRDRLARY